MLKQFENFGEYLKINVGGSLFQTTVATVKRAPEDSVIAALFSGRMNLKTDDEGWIMIDRCGKHFSMILNYLRDGEVPLFNNITELKELLIEARFYCLESLYQSIKSHIESIQEKDNNQPRIFIIEDEASAKSLIKSTLKPVVMLSISKRNKILAYSSNSQDHLLRNNECFEKYAVMFAGMITFIKNISNIWEKCEWTFYYRNNEIRSDKHKDQLNTEKGILKEYFNESKVYEELLLLISTAAKKHSDNELNKITKSDSQKRDNSSKFMTMDIIMQQGEPDIELSQELCYEIVFLFEKIKKEIYYNGISTISHHIVTRRFKPKNVKERGRSSIILASFQDINYSGFVALNNAS